MTHLRLRWIVALMIYLITVFCLISFLETFSRDWVPGQFSTTALKNYLLLLINTIALTWFVLGVVKIYPLSWIKKGYLILILIHLIILLF